MDDEDDFGALVGCRSDSRADLGDVLGEVGVEGDRAYGGEGDVEGIVIGRAELMGDDGEALGIVPGSWLGGGRC